MTLLDIKKYKPVGLVFLLVLGCQKNRIHHKTLDIEEVKKEIRESMTDIVFLGANREVVNHKKLDFFIPIFQSIKKLCYEIAHIEFTTTTTSFNIDITTNDGVKRKYTKKLDSEMKLDVVLENFQITPNKKVDEIDCDEFEKLIDFIQWDYEKNGFTSPSLGIPTFIENQIHDFNIYRKNNNLPKAFY